MTDHAGRRTKLRYENKIAAATDLELFRLFLLAAPSCGGSGNEK